MKRKSSAKRMGVETDHLGRGRAPTDANGPGESFDDGPENAHGVSIPLK